MTAFTILLGVVWRLAPLHLPGFAHKYGGSALYGIMFYWLIASIRPALRPLALAVASFSAATAVELFKLVHTPVLEAFRITLAGRLLIGRFFSMADLLAYAIGIGITLCFDRLLSKEFQAAPFR